MAETQKIYKACLNRFFIRLQTPAHLVRYPCEEPATCPVAPRSVLHRNKEPTREGSLRDYEDMPHVAEDSGSRR
jgi:hypothetical protein